MNKIDFSTLLALSPTELAQRKKICFQGAGYPLLFFTYYFSNLKKQGVVVQQLDLTSVTYADVVCQLEMHMLGASLIYWLGDLSQLSDAALKQYVAYLHQYSGPHQVYFFVQQQTAFERDTSVVVFPDVVTEVEYRALALFYKQDLGVLESFIKTVFAQYKTIVFEQALLLIQYQLFLGRRFQSFIQQWLPRIIVSEQSLFTLSQLFFARNYAHFLREWAVVKVQYPDEFWVVFWSEQVWQALIFIEHVKRGQLAEARKKVFRLPFSFMNKDWKSYTEHELARAHHFLYGIDHALKNGRAVDGIDLFVHTFLLRQFRI